LRREFTDKYLIAEYDTSGDATVISGGTDPYSTFGFSATWDLPAPGRPTPSCKAMKKPWTNC
jgi:hypothetical protein